MDQLHSLGNIQKRRKEVCFICLTYWVKNFYQAPHSPYPPPPQMLFITGTHYFVHLQLCWSGLSHQRRYVRLLLVNFWRSNGWNHTRESSKLLYWWECERLSHQEIASSPGSPIFFNAREKRSLVSNCTWSAGCCTHAIVPFHLPFPYVV